MGCSEKWLACTLLDVNASQPASQSAPESQPLGDLIPVERAIASAGSPRGDLSGDTPAMRIFSLLELIASKDEFVSLQGLVDETSLPKPTLHRMLQQLEAADLLVRQSDGRHYGSGRRLRAFAEDLLLNATQHGATHAALRHLVTETGESCNLTALSGDEVIYLDRIETQQPLRFYLRPGSRVPAHASASGKMILSQMTTRQRRKLLANSPLRACTPQTITDFDAFEEELRITAERGWALDNEEFLTGLVCAAMLIPTPTGLTNRCVAIQAPVMRVPADKLEQFIPALERTVQAIAQVEREGVSSEGGAG